MIVLIVFHSKIPSAVFFCHPKQNILSLGARLGTSTLPYLQCSDLQCAHIKPWTGYYTECACVIYDKHTVKLDGSTRKILPDSCIFLRKTSNQTTKLLLHSLQYWGSRHSAALKAAS